MPYCFECLDFCSGDFVPVIFLLRSLDDVGIFFDKKIARHLFIQSRTKKLLLHILRLYTPRTKKQFLAVSMTRSWVLPSRNWRLFYVPPTWLTPHPISYIPVYVPAYINVLRYIHSGMYVWFCT